jgi:hypothetical protein
MDNVFKIRGNSGDTWSLIFFGIFISNIYCLQDVVQGVGILQFVPRTIRNVLPIPVVP